MLFCIDESVIDVLKEEKVQNALTCLAMARRQGKHLVYANRHVLESLSQSGYLDDGIRAIYRKLYNRSVNSKMYYIKMKRRIELIGKRDIFDRHIDQDKIIIKRSIFDFDNIMMFCEANMLIEDTEDYRLYEYMGKYAISKYGLTGINLKFDVIPGSGSRIGKIFKERINNDDRLVLSLVDTDKKAPNGPSGSTYTVLMQEYRRNKRLGEVFEEEYHEVENLIPANLYARIPNFNTADVETYEQIATASEEQEYIAQLTWKEFALRVNDKNLKDIWLYFDFKEGIKYKTIKNINNREYWFDVFEKIGVNFNKQQIENILALESDLFKPYKEIVLVEGFNDKVLEKAYAILNEVTLLEIDYLLEDELKRIWTGMGLVIASWGCCGGRLIR